MNTIKLMQNTDLKEISSSELNYIQGGNAVAVAALAVAAIRLAMEASYNIGYAIGQYSATN
jgi:hypothetical protein